MTYWIIGGVLLLALCVSLYIAVVKMAPIIEDRNDDDY